MMLFCSGASADPAPLSAPPSARCDASHGAAPLLHPVRGPGGHRGSGKAASRAREEGRGTTEEGRGDEEPPEPTVYVTC
jgi:hypothetical protein